MVVSSPPCPCPPFLHYQLSDMALKEAEARAVDLVLAGWCHSTKRLFIVLLVYCVLVLLVYISISITITYSNHKFLMVSSPPCPPSSARRLGTARGGWYYSCPHSGRLMSWYETGAGALLVVSITYNLSQPYSVDCISTSVSIPSQETWHCKSARGGLCYSKPHSGRLAP